MFSPPDLINTEIFAELPPELRINRRSEWAETNHRGRKIDCFLEGPCFDDHGTLYVVDIPFGRILAVSPAGQFSVVCEYDGEPNGLKVHPDGRIFVADYKNGLLVLDPRTGAITPLIARRAGERFKGVNDLCLASNGDVYFTDQGQTGLQDSSGRIYRLAANGRLDLLLDNVPSPNGLTLDLQEITLFVAVTRGNCVWRLPLLPDGTTTKVGLFIQLSGGIGPDGLAMDAAGGLVVAHPGLGVVWHFDNLGQPLHRVQSVAGRLTTNIAFGGAGGRTLYITESETGVVLRADMPVAGKSSPRSA